MRGPYKSILFGIIGIYILAGAIIGLGLIFYATTVYSVALSFDEMLAIFFSLIFYLICAYGGYKLFRGTSRGVSFTRIILFFQLLAFGTGHVLVFFGSGYNIMFAFSIDEPVRFGIYSGFQALVIAHAPAVISTQVLINLGDVLMLVLFLFEEKRLKTKNSTANVLDDFLLGNETAENSEEGIKEDEELRRKLKPRFELLLNTLRLLADKTDSVAEAIENLEELKEDFPIYMNDMELSPLDDAGLLPGDQREDINRLYASLQMLDEEYWYAEAFLKREDWQDLRSLAGEILAKLEQAET